MTAAEAAWGIIPARAGFTGPLLGVVGGPGGSSPLARGLRRPLRPHGMLRRIIPARAGFTRGMSRSTTTCADHPRSRGVYCARQDGALRLGGSSPLARGLPMQQKHLWIPRLDHPRSRGVYVSGLSSALALAGSSPLARGLLVVRSCALPLLRIIPARAGFTAREGRRRPERSDHPRSRGVYRSALAASASGPGSSPLARGLRGHQGRTEPLTRIIPARAGFTPTTSTPSPTRSDHPRSRGVYP